MICRKNDSLYLSLRTGAYCIQRSFYLDADLNNASGHYNGQKVTVFANLSQPTYVPGRTIPEAAYKAFIIVPFISEGLDRTTTATGPIGHYNPIDFANPKIEPLNLTWNLGGGFNVGSVAYYLKQVTGDNKRRAVFGGNTFSAPYNLAFGGLISHSFGPASVVAYITRDVSWSNTIGGTKGWLGVSFKLIWATIAMEIAQ